MISRHIIYIITILVSVIIVSLGCLKPDISHTGETAQVSTETEDMLGDKSHTEESAQVSTETEDMIGNESHSGETAQVSDINLSIPDMEFMSSQIKSIPERLDIVNPGIELDVPIPVVSNISMSEIEDEKSLIPEKIDIGEINAYSEISLDAGEVSVDMSDFDMGNIYDKEDYDGSNNQPAPEQLPDCNSYVWPPDCSYVPEGPARELCERCNS